MLPADGHARRRHLLRAQRRAVAGLRALLVGRTLADNGPAADQRGPAGLVAGRLNRRLDLRRVVAIDLIDDLPAVGPEAGRGVVGKPALHLAIDRNAVVVVKRDQLAQAQGARQGADLVGDALHQATVPEEDVGVVVDDVVALAIELGGQHFLRQRHADRIGQPLAEGAGGGLDARRVAVLRVTRRLAVQLAEILQLLHRQVVAGEVQQGVEQHGAVAVGQHKAVPVGPAGIGRVVAQVVVPQHFGDIRHAHGGARMAAVGLLYGIHTQGADGIGKIGAGGRHRFLQQGRAMKSGRYSRVSGG